MSSDFLDSLPQSAVSSVVYDISKHSAGKVQNIEYENVNFHYVYQYEFTEEFYSYKVSILFLISM